MTKPTKNFKSVSTDELYNDEEPNLDISKYSWRALTDAIDYNRVIDSIDGWEQTTSGSGSISFTAGTAQLDTGGTSGSVAELYERIQTNTRIVDRDWSKDRIWRCPVQIRDSGADRTDYYVWGGDPTGGNNAIGFKVNNGDLLGIVHDGTSETTTTLISSVGTGTRKLRFEYIGGSVEYFVDRTSEGTISSGLPSGTGFAEFHARYRVENSTGASRSIRIDELRIARAP